MVHRVEDVAVSAVDCTGRVGVFLRARYMTVSVTDAHSHDGPSFSSKWTVAGVDWTSNQVLKTTQRIGNLSTSMYHCCFVAMRFSVCQSSYKFATRLKTTSLYSLFSFFLYRHRRELQTYITGLLIVVLSRSLLWFSVDSSENKERKVPFLSHVQSLPRMVLFCVVACI